MTTVPKPAGNRTPANESAPDAGQTLQFSAIGPPTPAEVDWVDENLGALPTVVRVLTEPAARHWQHEDGNWYRRCGSVSVDLERGRFSINLYAGAILSDLGFFEFLIAHAKEGLFLRAGWRQMTREDGSTWWLNNFSRGVPGPELHTYQHEILACAEPACTETWHDDAEPLHIAEHIEAQGYTIDVALCPGDAEWVVMVNTADDVELTPKRALSLANDLQWVAAAASKLNATRTEVADA